MKCKKSPVALGRYDVGKGNNISAAINVKAFLKLIRALTVFVGLFFYSTNLPANNQTPQFGDYKVVEKQHHKNAPIILSKKDRSFRTRLKEAAKQKPNFAGHYILTVWGCGMECLMGAVIDAKSGKVYQLPFTICCWGDEVGDDFKPIEFRSDSKLIIFTGARDEKEDDVKKHYYVFDKNSFKEIQ